MHFRLRTPSGQLLDEGDGEVRVAGGALLVTPRLGQPLRIRPIDVVSVDEPQPYVLSLTLAEGPVLELAQMGSMRNQVLAEFTAVRREDTVHTLLLTGTGTPVTYQGALADVPAEIRLYDDALVAVPSSGEPEHVLFSFVDAVDTDRSGYRITVAVTGREPVVVNRMASRTSEFRAELERRVTGARARSATLIDALLPGLGSLGQRGVAGLLRDGVAVRTADLDAVEPTVSAALLRVCTRGDRVATVRALGGLGPLWLVLHQRTSVEVAACGHADLGARAVAVEEHGGMPSAPGGFAGILGAEVRMSGPDPFGFAPGGVAIGAGAGAGGGWLEMAVLGGMAGPGGMAATGGIGALYGDSTTTQHQVQPRQEPRPLTGLRTGYTDYTALGVSGETPTVLAAVFAETEHAIVYEVLNDADHATYVYDRPPGGVPGLAAGLALIGYRVSAIYSGAGIDSTLKDAVARLPHLAALRGGFRGRAIHTDGWLDQLQGLLAG